MSSRPVSFRPISQVLLALLSVVLLFAATFGASPSALAADGDLDQTFVGIPQTGANDIVYATAVQSDGKVVVGGQFTTMNGALRNYIARLNADGSLDASFAPGGGANSSVYTTLVQPDGKILIGGTFTIVNGIGRNRIARLNTDGSLDTSFVPGIGANGAVYDMELQADGKIILAGAFTQINGSIRDRIARLNPDGSLDSTFVPASGANNDIYELALQPDGRIMVSGAFTTVNGVLRGRIARFNTNGSLDASFAPAEGANGVIYAMALQADGKILIGGTFSAVNSLARTNLARLNADGTIDGAFGIGGGANALVQTLVQQPNGKILLGGDFTTINGVGRARMARLNADGSLDPAFTASASGEVHAINLQADGRFLAHGVFTVVNGITRSRIARLNADGSLDPGFVTARGTNDTVYAVAVQQDGKSVIGGSFTLFNDVSRNRIARLNADGSLDTAFAPAGGANGPIYELAIQPDGKIIVVGDFTSINGTARNYIARFNTDGSLDTTFAINGGANNTIHALALQPDGKILIGGAFTTIHGVARNRIARLNADGSLDATFTPTGTNGFVETIALQSDGRIVIGGGFTAVNSTTRYYIARLNSDGGLDTSFAGGTNHYVYKVVFQADGKILLGGVFTTVNGVTRNHIARLNSDGTLDGSFAPGGGANNYVHFIVAQADGKVIIGGQFTSINGVGRSYIGRFNADGSLDATFAPAGANAMVDSMAVQADGKLLVGGRFTSFNSVGRNRIARLEAGANTPEPSPSPSPSPIPTGPRIFLSRPNVAVARNQTFQIDLRIDTDGREVDTLEAYLNFDPTLLRVIDTAGNELGPNDGLILAPTFPQVHYNKVDNASGQINLSMSNYDSPYPRGTYTIATIRFRAVAATVSTPIRFVQSGARWSDLLLDGTSIQPSFGNTNVRILSAVTLNGRVALEQRGATGDARWVTELFRTEGVTTTGGISLYEPGTNILKGQFSTTTDTTGRFNVTLDGVQAGVYDIRVKGSNTLSNQLANVDLSDPTVEFDFGTLRVGDSNGDDGVSGQDVSYIIPSFLLARGESGFRPYADTNNNGAVNGQDVSALLRNFLKEGPLAVSAAPAQATAGAIAQSSTQPTLGLSPALQSVKVGDTVQIQVQAALGDVEADTMDIYLNFNPALLEVVSMTPNSEHLPNVTFTGVNNELGQINLSASRFAGPTTGTVTVATFAVRAKQAFTAAPIAVVQSGARQSDMFMTGNSIKPLVTGGMLTTGEVHHVYVPSAQR